MKKIDKLDVERKLQRAIVLEYVHEYCNKNNISIDKLKKEIFNLSYDVCGFFHPSEVEPNGLLNDLETLPKPTLIIKYKDEELVIEQTEYTKDYLYVD